MPFATILKFSIGHRLFASVLLAILAVAASAVFLLRQNVLASFGDYAAGIELDRLDELSAALARKYRSHGGWTFVPENARRDWIALELARLQHARERAAVAAPAAPVFPAAPAAPAEVFVPSAPPADHALDAADKPDAADVPDAADADGTANRTPPAVRPVPAALPAPPAPPAPPAVPLPPLPPPRLPELAGTAGAADSIQPLPLRITLLDVGGRYLAGYQAGYRAGHQAGHQANAPAAAAQARRAIEVDGRTVGWLAVVRGARPSDAMAYAFLEQLRSSLWLIVAAAVALSALAAVLLARHFRRPIRSLEDGARRLAEGRFDTRLPDARSDELGELARHFNALAGRLASAEDARRQWVADTSHELRTPLAVLRAQVEALQDGVRGATPATYDAMLRQVLALNKLIDDLYLLARADVGALECRPVVLDLWQLAAAQAAGFEARLQAAGLALELDAPPERALVLADADRMRQVLDNLLENSLRYTAPGGRVRLGAHVAGPGLRLVLDDSAPGVPDDALAHLSERFHRVDASRSRAHGGAGLGLALCRRLLDAQGATLHFTHSPLGGLRALIHIPLAEDAQ